MPLGQVERCHHYSPLARLAEWQSLIEQQNLPFLKVSLLRDNPHSVDISNWKDVVGQGNHRLVKQISQQLQRLNQNQTEDKRSQIF